MSITYIQATLGIWKIYHLYLNTGKKRFFSKPFSLFSGILRRQKKLRIIWCLLMSFLKLSFILTFLDGVKFLYSPLLKLLSVFSCSPLDTLFYLSTFFPSCFFFISQISFFLIISIIKLTLFCHFINMLWNKRKIVFFLRILSFFKKIFITSYGSDNIPKMWRKPLLREYAYSLCVRSGVLKLF